MTDFKHGNINGIAITGEDIARVLTEIKLRHSHGMEPKENEGSLEMIVRLFKDEPGKIKAVYCRVYALFKLIKKNKVNEFVQTWDDGTVMVNPGVIKAAAEYPLTMNDDDDMEFDVEGFLAKVFELAEAIGTT